MDIAVGTHQIGPGRPCFVIAEAGVNHNGDVDLALKLVDAAAAKEMIAVKTEGQAAVEAQNAIGAKLITDLKDNVLTAAQRDTLPKPDTLPAGPPAGPSGAPPAQAPEKTESK